MTLAEDRAFAKWAEKFALQRRLSLRIEKISNWLTSFVGEEQIGAFPYLLAATPARTVIGPGSWGCS